MIRYYVCVVYCTDNYLEVFTSVYFIRYGRWSVGLLRSSTGEVLQLLLVGARSNLEQKENRDFYLLKHVNMARML